ncbi:MAG TPA: sulfatase-like hydrolase/transferase, partial [Polyangiaceae bacterium]
ASGAAVWVGLGTSHGRHFASVAARAAFAGGFGVVAFALTLAAGAWVARAVDRAPELTGLVAVLVALALEVANVRVLPRLYPTFHIALTVLTAMMAYPIGRGLTFFPAFRRWYLAVALLILLWAAAVARAPALARRPMLTDNMKLVFAEHAPLMGHGVDLAMALARREEATAADRASAAAVTPERRLAVDWRGRDILLISVDALRADHVGAYGYARPTTPHLDELAREGTVFERAYCPTPHTSYSIASMMTGKALRPLLTHGLGADSDTLARILRTYGYRTAAFYPPAVFFVDAELFAPFQTQKLDFEYARVEFADAPERARSVQRYLSTQSADARLLLWVHLFEPHEPYLPHPEHPFGDRDVDRYDSEIAVADEGIGAIVTAVRKVRPSAIVMVTGDHGEAFGEHDSRYHGTAVYEEQVRVPLIVAGANLPVGKRIATPVQTIDILPTVLSALDIPRPPRIDGNDLGPLLGRDANKAAEEAASRVALAETDEQVLIAESKWRLVCTRRAGACALYDVESDPDELVDVSRAHDERVARLKGIWRTLEGLHGRYEGARIGEGAARPWPEALRRGMNKDGDAAPEVAALLDDSDVLYRRKAAEVLFDLKRESTAAALSLALARDSDAQVRSGCALALARLGQIVPQAVDLLKSDDERQRRLAALAFAENGDRRGATVLSSWWQAEVPPFERARDVLAAMAKIQDKDAVPALLASLDDVRLRPYVADTLAAIGQPAARAPLLARFAEERYQNARVALGDALVRLGVKAELADPLVRFLGTPDPMPNGVDLAVRAGILSRIGGPDDKQLERLQSATSGQVPVAVSIPKGGNGHGRRILLRAHARNTGKGEVPVAVGDKSMTFVIAPGSPPEQSQIILGSSGPTAELLIGASPEVAIDALAMVPLSDELPPPPPEPWQSPAEDVPDGGSPAEHLPHSD